MTPHSDQPAQAPQAEDLQELVLVRLQEMGDKTGPMSAREASRRADGLISYESLRLIARGMHGGGLTDRTAQGLALALDVPVGRVYAAAGLPPKGEHWEWPDRFERLPPAQRRLVEDVAGALLEMYDKGRRERE